MASEVPALRAAALAWLDLPLNMRPSCMLRFLKPEVVSAHVVLCSVASLFCRISWSVGADDGRHQLLRALVPDAFAAGPAQGRGAQPRRVRDLRLRDGAAAHRLGQPHVRGPSVDWGSSKIGR